MVKISRQKMVLFRVAKLRKAIRIDTQQMREKVGEGVCLEPIAIGNLATHLGLNVVVI